MKRLSIFAGLAFLLVAVEWAPGAAGGDKANLDKVEYFPLKVGTSWEYLAGGKTIKVKVAAHEMVDGMNCAKVDTDSGGVTLTEHLTVKDGGVYRVRANGQKIDPPFLVIKLPPKPGEEWKNNCVAGGFKVDGTFKIGEQKKVKVGNTEYDAIVVTSENLKISGQEATMTTWFDKEKGMVKQAYSLPNSNVDVTLELDKFNAGK
jgi:hypothetical protein